LHLGSLSPLDFFMQTLPPWPYPRLVAHRGAGTLAPENTLAAMRVGASFGYMMVEFDAKLSQDHVAILLHDTNLERTTNGQGNAADHPYTALAKLDAGLWFAATFRGEPIPTLEAVAKYTLAQNMASNIEIKPTPGLETLTGTAIARQVMRDWQGAAVAPLLSSFSLAALEAAQKEAPNLPRGWITKECDKDWRETLTRLGCVSIHLHHLSLTESLLHEIHTAGFRVAVWTVNDPTRAATLLKWGVDSVITDALDLIDPA
jgi:glycerophosphoryl diester phosphodiesterase